MAYFVIEPWEKGRLLRLVLGFVCQIVILCTVLGAVSSVEAGEISVLAPTAVESTIYSRNKIVNVVVKVNDSSDLNRLAMVLERDGRRFEPIGRHVKNGVYFVHYSLPLKRGKNNFVLSPIRRSIKIKFVPLASLLNVNFEKPGTYLFHRDETIPAVCAGCHTSKLPSGAKFDRVQYGRFSPECYSCHGSVASASEWRHFPSSGLLCMVCHQSDPNKKGLEIPTGKVEGLCFECHINDSKWISMKHIHGPVGTGDCTICHDPHGSNNKFQLWADGKARLCVVCHEDKRKFLAQNQKRFFVHGILNAKGCVVCHSPHATDYRFQLYGEINDLCVSCHTGLRGVKKGHPVHMHPVEGKKDPRRKGYAFTCTSCHNPHGSKNKYLLIGNVRGGQVCVMCHDGMKAW